MSKESLIRELVSPAYQEKLVHVCNALNFSNHSGLYDENKRVIKSNAMDISYMHGYSIRQIANALNLCQRAKD